LNQNKQRGLIASHGAVEENRLL